MNRHPWHKTTSDSDSSSIYLGSVECLFITIIPMSTLTRSSSADRVQFLGQIDLFEIYL